MTPREKLQLCYELAFFPPRLHEAWHRVKRGHVPPGDDLGELLDTALLLHRTLPSGGYASQRALNRLALHQAKARAFGAVRFLENVRRRMGRAPLERTVIPGHLVRDIRLPPLSRRVPGARRNPTFHGSGSLTRK